MENIMTESAKDERLMEGLTFKLGEACYCRYLEVATKSTFREKIYIEWLTCKSTELRSRDTTKKDQL